MTKFFLKLVFGTFRHFLHILFIQKRYFLDKSGNNLPNIGDSTISLNFVQSLQNVLQKHTRSDHFFGEQEFGYMFYITNKTLLIDLRYIASFLKNTQRARDEFWKKFESLLQQPMHDLFTVYIEDLLQILAYELFEGLFNIISNMIIKQGL